jgi:hypothetical protein
MAIRFRANRACLGVLAVLVGAVGMMACAVKSNVSSSSGEASLEAAMAKIVDAEVDQEQPPAVPGQGAQQGQQAQGPGQCVTTAQDCRKACLAALPHQQMVEGLRKCQEDYRSCVASAPTSRKSCREALKTCLQSTRSTRSTQMDTFRQCMQKCSSDLQTCQGAQPGEDEAGANEAGEDGVPDAADNAAPPAP